MVEEELATALEAAVLAVPGVVGLYRSGTLLGNALEAATEVIGLRDAGPRLRITREAERTRVEAAVGASDSAAASITVARVRDAIIEVVEEHSLPPADVVLTIVRVESA